MEKRDIEIILKYGTKDEVLANLYQEHLDFEKKLEELEKKPSLTMDEELRIKDLKKRKLKGRDLMENLLRKYRAAER